MDAGRARDILWNTIGMGRYGSGWGPDGIA